MDGVYASMLTMLEADLEAVLASSSTRVNNARAAGSTLTEEKIHAAMALLPKLPPDPFNPFRMPFRPFGRELFEAPPPARLQVRDIKFKDGTSILPAGFLADQNARWLDRFGYRDDPFKDKIYLLGSYGMVASPQNCAIIRNVL